MYIPIRIDRGSFHFSQHTSSLSHLQLALLQCLQKSHCGTGKKHKISGCAVKIVKNNSVGSDNSSFVGSVGGEQQAQLQS
jgi:hypothetical protein